MGLRYYQAMVVQDIGFRSTVEASVMRVAYEVLLEPDGKPDSNARKNAARAMFRGLGSEKSRFVELFAWYTVFQPDVQEDVYDVSENTIHPERLDDEVMDGHVRAFWSSAASFENGG